MNQNELQRELAKMLEQVGIIMDEDTVGIEVTLNDREIISYILFIRVVEIFKAIATLFVSDLDQVVPANILLRSLSEYYILLKSSIEDDGFNAKHIKFAGYYKETWLKKVLWHHSISGFKEDPKYFEEMKEKARQFHEEYKDPLANSYKLFKDRNEHWMYLNVYASASMYVHGNRQSFNIYHNPDGSVKPTLDRDYSSLLIQTALATAQIVLQSYRLFCMVVEHDTGAIKRIEELTEKFAEKIKKTYQTDYPE